MIEDLDLKKLKGQNLEGNRKKIVYIHTQTPKYVS